MKRWEGLLELRKECSTVKGCRIKCYDDYDARSIEVTDRCFPPKPFLVEGLPVPHIGRFQLDDKAVGPFLPWDGVGLMYRVFAFDASDSLKEIRKGKWN